MLWIERRKTRRPDPFILYNNIFHTHTKKGWNYWCTKRCTYVSSSALTNWTCLCCSCWWRLAIAKKIHLSTFTHLHAIPNSWRKVVFQAVTKNHDWSFSQKYKTGPYLVTSQNIFVSKQTKFDTFNEPRVEFKNQVVLICESIFQTRLVNQINLFKSFICSSVFCRSKKFIQTGMTC